ncbi:MAG: RHS repeat domain-containing protein, partial [Sodaliphilus sp.]
MAAIPSENQQPYKYGAKELDRQNGIDLYDFHARQMDPLVGRFTSIDKKSEKFYSISPYTYCAANPIAFVDPTGNSTRVVSLGDDKYRVESVNLKDNDKNIYVKKNGKIFSIGVTPCLTTFYASKKNGNGGQVVKSIINLKDNSGTDFQKQVKLNPDIAHYVNDWGRSGHKWDFKNVGYSKEKGDKQLYQYRGMPIGRNPEGKKIICSARDLGNWAAGYISGVNGISWSMSRMAFDLYEMISNRRIGVEENSTVNAEFWGWSEGNSIWKNQLFKLLIPIDW